MPVHPSKRLTKRVRTATSATAKALSSVLAGDLMSVHATRKEIKRLRSLMLLAAEAATLPRIAEHDRVLADAARSLAGIRHDQAMKETIDKIALSLGDTAGTCLREALALTPPAAGESASAPRLDPAPLNLALAALAALTRGIAAPKPRRRHDAIIVTAISQTYARARRLLRKGFRQRDFTRLHKARRAIIHLLHQQDVIAALWPSQFALWHEALGELREHLGDINDLVEMQHRLRGIDRPVAIRANAALEKRRADLLAAARTSARLLFADKRKPYESRLQAWLAASR